MFIASSGARAAGSERSAGIGTVRSGLPAVLVADEAVDVALLLRETFGADYDVLAAASGEEALPAP